jgi:hypothetical protein
MTSMQSELLNDTGRVIIGYRNLIKGLEKRIEEYQEEIKALGGETNPPCLAPCFPCTCIDCPFKNWPEFKAVAEVR